jgi:hypothetical protein
MLRIFRPSFRRPACQDPAGLPPEMSDRLLRDIGACARSEAPKPPLALRLWP